MPLDAIDLVEGFASSYRTLGIAYKTEFKTTLTHRILNYFDLLGGLLGYKVHLEEKKLDLVWYDHSVNAYSKNFFHLEHENEIKRFIPKTLEEKLIKSESFIRMGIVTVKEVSKEGLDEITDWVNKNLSRFNGKECILFINTTSICTSLILKSKRKGRPKVLSLNFEKKYDENNEAYFSYDTF